MATSLSEIANLGHIFRKKYYTDMHYSILKTIYEYAFTELYPSIIPKHPA